MAGHLTLDEQEIIVSMCGRTDIVQVYTSYPHWIKRLDKYCAEEPDNWKCVRTETIEGDVVGKFYEGPKDLFKLAKRKRRVSEEQRAANAARLAAYRQKQDEERQDDDE